MADKSERVLFPDRGSKVELGKVFHPLAFGSTKPRNMMPGHLTAEDDERASKNLARLSSDNDKVRCGVCAGCDWCLVLGFVGILHVHDVDSALVRPIRDVDGALTGDCVSLSLLWLSCPVQITKLRLDAHDKHERVKKLQQEFEKREQLRTSHKRLKQFRSGVKKIEVCVFLCDRPTADADVVGEPARRTLTQLGLLWMPTASGSGLQATRQVRVPETVQLCGQEHVAAGRGARVVQQVQRRGHERDWTQGVAVCWR